MVSTGVAPLHYQAEGGKGYLQQRRGATSDHVQSLRASLFADLPTADCTVLDFGCGTGGLLSRLDCLRRVGVEIGEAAAEEARANGLEVHSTLSELDENSVDVAISFHAIEHVQTPVEVLREIARVTKPDGLVRLIVPGENPLDPRQGSWQPNADMHLYTWTPLNFGNLAAVAGMSAIRAEIAPMPTASRLVGLLRGVPPLANLAHRRIAHRLNSWNVILNCRAPAAART